VIFVGVSVCVLAVVGVVALSRRRRWPALVGWIAGLVAIIVLAAGPPLIAQLPLVVVRYPARLIPFGTFCVAALAAYGWDSMRRTRWMDALLAAVIILELIAASSPLLATDKIRATIPLPRAIGRTSKILRLADDPRRLALNSEGWLSGYLNLYEHRFDAWTAAPFTSRRYAQRYESALHDPASARIIGVGYVLASRPMPPPRFIPVARSLGVMVYRVADSLPMSYLLLSRRAVAPSFMAFSPGRAFVNVDAPERGTLVLTQNDAPGWRVFVDGVEMPKKNFDSTFRAVDVGAGHHEVMWSYHPRSLIIGAVMTVTTLLSVVSYKVIRRRSLARLQ
jgi:hypothetical protein